MIANNTLNYETNPPPPCEAHGEQYVSNNHRVARALAAAGIPVFPAKPELNPKKLPDYMPDKGPLEGLLWSREATTDSLIIDNWWRNKTDALVCIPAKQAGLFIVDADRHPGKPDGLKAFEELIEANGGLPSNVVLIDTQSGGRHYVFKQPEGFVLGNSSGGLPPEVDTRGASGQGGYIIAPGTEWQPPEGELRYWREAEGSPSLIEAYESDAIPVVPDWIVNIVQQPKHAPVATALLDTHRQPSLSERAGSLARKPDSATVPNFTGASSATGMGEWIEQSKKAEEFELVSKAIFHVSASPRETWLGYGGALHDRFGEAGKPLWNDWSRTCPEKYDPIEQDKAWRSYSRNYAGKRTTIGSILHDARVAGFVDASFDHAASQRGFNLKADTGSPEVEQVNVEASQANSANEDRGGDAGGKGHGFRLWMHGDPMPPPANDLVEDFISHGGYTIIAGQSQAGKSFVTIELGVCVAGGIDFFGHKVKEATGVIFLLGEGYYTFHSRFHATLAKHGLQGVTLPICAIGDPGDLTSPTGNAETRAKIKYAAEMLKQLHGADVGLIVIDTVMACCTIKNENDAGEMAGVARSIGVLRPTSNTAVVGVFHQGHNVATGPRGSTATKAAADNILMMLCERGEATVTNRRLILSKSRTGPEGETIPLELEPVEIMIGLQEIKTARLIKVGDDRRRDTAMTSADSRLIRHLSYSLEHAIIDAGVEKRFWGDAPIVKAARKNAVRDVFMAGWEVKGDTDARRRRNKEQAFRRALGDARDKNIVQYHEDGSGEWIWFLKTKSSRKGEAE